MLYFFRVLIILLKGIIPCFASVFSMVWLVSAVSFRSFRPFRSFWWFRFGGFVSLFRVLVHAFTRDIEENTLRTTVYRLLDASSYNLTSHKAMSNKTLMR